VKKEFSSFKQQLDHIQVNKGLSVCNPEYAEAKLMQIGYFALIGGYKNAFKNPYTSKYRENTQFEDIVALYEFDRELRELFLSYLLQSERHIRSLMSYYFTEKYGEQQSQYLNAANFTANPKHRNNVKKLIHTLCYLANKNTDYLYIRHQRRKYGNVPLWVLMNGVTFGTLSIFYLLTQTDIRAKVSKHFAGMGEAQLEKFLNVMSKFRNVCAHGERLFTYRTRNTIMDMPIHSKLKIPRAGNQYTYGKQDLFAVVIAFRYLLPDEDFKIFKKTLAEIIHKYLTSTTALNETELYDIIGFPAHWKSITRYKR